MPRVRVSSLDRLISLLAAHAEAWFSLWESCPPLLGYLARNGAWHLVRAGRCADAVAFLGRLRGFDGREEVVSPQEENAALADGLVALKRCTAAEAQRVDGPTLASLLRAVHDRDLLRLGCRLLAGRSAAEIAQAFSYEPNPSAAVAYVLAEEIARVVDASADRKAWEKLAAIGEDHEHPIQYTALYAFKYVAATRPDWLNADILRPFAIGGPYDRLAATTLLLFLALQGHVFPVQFSESAFWEPRWPYNEEEISLLRGAMYFRGLTVAEGDDARDELGFYTNVEQRRFGVLRRLGPDDTLLRMVVEGYWSLVSSLETLSRISIGLLGHPLAEDVAWLLMVSPYWEVSEVGSSLLARFAALDARWEELLIRWSVNEDTTTWWGALVALRIHAERTGREEPLFAALRVQARSDSAQLRGNCANTLQTLISSSAPNRRIELLHTFVDELRELLHGDDVWAVHEVLLMLEQLGEDREACVALLDADRAPLLEHTPEWRELVAAEWGDLVTERLSR